MDYVIRKKERRDCEDVAHIVTIVWNETYRGIMTDEFLDKISQVVIEDTLEGRKKRLLAADIVVFAPGGVGTLDELAYDCVAMQDGFLKNKPFVIYNINNFFYHILETLKELTKTGFATRMPFIVVDNSEDLETVFRLLKLKYNKCETDDDAYFNARLLAYEMPYIIKRRMEQDIRVEELLDVMQKIKKSGTPEEKENLAREIEQAYLEKEIERMYDRLAKTGRETGDVSEKLLELKKRKQSRHKNLK